LTVDDRKNPDVTEYLTLAEAAKLIPGRRAGKRISKDTIWRWCLRGVANGLRLKSVLIGGQRCTTRTWLQEFIDARSGLTGHAPAPPPPPCSSGQRQRESQQAAENLRQRWSRRRR
jgi:hypothetical protein